MKLNVSKLCISIIQQKSCKKRSTDSNDAIVLTDEPKTETEAERVSAVCYGYSDAWHLKNNLDQFSSRLGQKSINLSRLDLIELVCRLVCHISKC